MHQPGIIADPYKRVFTAEGIVLHKGDQAGPDDREHQEYKHHRKARNQYQQKKSATTLFHMITLPISVDLQDPVQFLLHVRKRGVGRIIDA